MLQGRKDCNVECFIVAFSSSSALRNRGAWRMREVGGEGEGGREDCREGKMKGEKREREREKKRKGES
jgi:hypothetical protein